MLYEGCISVFQLSYRNFRRFRQTFRNIVFCGVDFDIYMQILSRGRFESVLNCFLYYECF